MSELNHFNRAGEAHMVDVGDKAETNRRAVAEGRIFMEAKTLQLILAGGHGKGDVLGIARVAGLMASKRTADLVPLCHPLPITHVDLTFTPESEDAVAPGVACQVTVSTCSRTGVEMEALTAVSVALLTIYDMCKAVDRGMTISAIRLVEKSGGRSGHWSRSRKDDV